VSVRAVLCSTNEHKARELGRVLPGWTIELLDDDSYPPEDGETYYENARGKAVHGRALADPELWVLGEDSGIEVAGLGGRPGVHSARFAAGDPVGRLLDELAGIAGEARRARYVCELVALSPEGEELRGTGVLEGRIVESPAGSEGFGYDPIFAPGGVVRWVGVRGHDWMAAGNSHRARAARALHDTIRNRL
jgi:XTP/dITP diphosphohydrolase